MSGVAPRLSRSRRTDRRWPAGRDVSWQSVFYINVPVGALGLVVGLLALPDSRDRHPGALDAVGLVVLAAGLFCVVLAMIKAETSGWGDAKTIGLLAGGPGLLVVLGFMERRVHAPLLPRRCSPGAVHQTVIDPRHHRGHLGVLRHVRGVVLRDALPGERPRLRPGGRRGTPASSYRRLRCRCAGGRFDERSPRPALRHPLRHAGDDRRIGPAGRAAP